jgi:peptide/nickel transport system substrate-binding protein
MDVLDPLTLRFTLNEAWTGFPYLLAGDGGFVASPTAIQKLGDSFNVDPVGAGAGPFQFESFQANEAVTLTDSSPSAPSAAPCSA